MLKEAERYTRERLTQDWQAECNHWMDRAIRAEAELRRCYKDIEELTAECTDQKAMLADAGIRNEVLQRRVDRLIDVLYLDHEQLPEGYCETPPDGVDCELAYECRKCWREWLEQEVKL